MSHMGAPKYESSISGIGSRRGRGAAWPLLFLLEVVNSGYLARAAAFALIIDIFQSVVNFEVSSLEIICCNFFFELVKSGAETKCYAEGLRFQNLDVCLCEAQLFHVNSYHVFCE